MVASHAVAPEVVNTIFPVVLLLHQRHTVPIFDLVTPAASVAAAEVAPAVSFETPTVYGFHLLQELRWDSVINVFYVELKLY